MGSTRKRPARGAASPISNLSPLPRVKGIVRSYAFIAIVSVVSVVLGACGGSAREGTVEYSVSAAQNYDLGMKKLKEEEWTDAVRYFTFVKARFPYSKYAVLADLRMADAAFGAEAYAEAVDAYKMFIKFHPTHEMVENGYAAFRIAQGYEKMLPDDWFLVPPAYEKDMSSALDAARELASVIRNYPRSQYVPKAKELHKKVAHLLAQHEWYVANFYWKKDAPMGTVLRLRTLLKEYPDAGYDERALYLLGQAYSRVGRPDDAKKAFETLIETYPKDPLADDARKQIMKR
jgi:outer membrane protein assembly factor BamD